MPTNSRQIHSLVSEDGVLSVSLQEASIPDPGPNEVLVRVEATPINPSDLGLLFGVADMSTARFGGTEDAPTIEADVPEAGMRMMSGRIGQSLPVGNEGAGTVIAAGESDAAQALLGKTVGMFGGELYAEYRCLPVTSCLPLEVDDVSV